MKARPRVLCFAALMLAGASLETFGAGLGFERPINPRWFPNDARQWSEYGRSVVLTDLSQAEPAAALVTGLREKCKWKVLPFETKDLKGQALSVLQDTRPVPVRLALHATGWHAVYVGIGTCPRLDDAVKNGVRVKLGSAPIYLRISNNLHLVAPRRDVIAEEFVTVANLGPGETIEFAPLPNLPATLAYVRLVPITEAERIAWEHDGANTSNRTEVATNDGHSWIWPFAPRDANGLIENFEGFQRTDVNQWWFCVLGADLTCYPSKVGTISGDEVQDFPSELYAEFTRSVHALVRNGVNPLVVAAQAARSQGREFHVFIRPQGWGASNPYDEIFQSRFYRDHPQWRCVDREGKQAMYLSYAIPEVRRHILDVYREAISLTDPDGVGLFFNRGIPLMLWEKSFSDQFRAQYGIDIMSVSAEDPRIHELRARIMTGFMRDLRAMLDELGAPKHKRYKISATTFTEERFNRRFGLDVETWAKEGLVDQLAITSPSENYDPDNVPPDVAYYHRLAAHRDLKIFPMIMAWDITPGHPKESLTTFCQSVLGWYSQGADGISVWDPAISDGFRNNKSEGDQMDVLAYLGNKELLTAWAKTSVPSQNSIPFLKLGENEYSEWLPNRGY